MKEYRLTAWLDLAPPFDRTAHRRLLSDLSHRFMSMSELVAASRLRRGDVRGFLAMLDARGLLVEREAPSGPSFWSLRPLGVWLRHRAASLRKR